MNSLDYLIERISVDDDGCWRWLAHRNEKGYGYTGDGLAHRVVYEKTVGPIPEGLVLDHICENPPCVNPDHLEPVTNAENKRRAQERAVTCKRGHLWSEHAYWYSAYGEQVRQCRECYRIRRAEYRSQGKIK